jgi:hypothetical protein
MNAKDAIQNLKVMSEVLEKAANKPENYNSNYGSYLEQMSWEMHRMSNELKELNYMYGVSL